MKELIASISNTLKDIKHVRNYDMHQSRIEALKKEMQSKPASSSELQEEYKLLIKSVTEIEQLEEQLKNLEDIVQLINSADSLWEDCKKELERLAEQTNNLYLSSVFNLPEDKNDAFIDIQAGSGGIDAHDWAEMLMRMYMKFVVRKNFVVRVNSIAACEVKGIRSCTLEIIGKYAYGWLKTETGIHRLVRRSPFDSSHRRHTSFASVYIYPKIDKTICVNINPSDLRIDTFKASGAGGQHVNKTDSAVRIVHIPTKTTVQCQSDRSQHKNKEQAMEQMMSKLYQIELQKLEEKSKETFKEKQDITWGKQIRSYILDQSRIKDLRTNIETKNIQKVLDGDLDLFIIAYMQNTQKEDNDRKK